MLLVLLTVHVPPVQAVPPPHVLLPRVLQVSILLLIMDVLRVPLKLAVPLLVQFVLQVHLLN